MPAVIEVKHSPFQALGLNFTFTLSFNGQKDIEIKSGEAATPPVTGQLTKIKYNDITYTPVAGGVMTEGAYVLVQPINLPRVDKELVVMIWDGNTGSPVFYFHAVKPQAIAVRNSPFYAMGLTDTFTLHFSSGKTVQIKSQQAATDPITDQLTQIDHNNIPYYAPVDGGVMPEGARVPVQTFNLLGLPQPVIMIWNGNTGGSLFYFHPK